MPDHEDLRELLRRQEFGALRFVGLRVLRALADGATLNTYEVMEAAGPVDGPMTYQQARLGCRNLLDYLADGELREWGTWRDDVAGAIAIESVSGRGRSLTTLTALGLELAATSMKLVGPTADDELAGAPEPIAERPPEPRTPLWRVLWDHGEVLVIAATAQQAIALYEGETGEQASRAEPVDTTAPLVLGWSRRKRE